MYRQDKEPLATDELLPTYGKAPEPYPFLHVPDVLLGHPSAFPIDSLFLRVLQPGSHLASYQPREFEGFVVFEDAASGIEAAKSLCYCAIGVRRMGEEEALWKAGADVVFKDLRKLEVNGA